MHSWHSISILSCKEVQRSLRVGWEPNEFKGTQSHLCLLPRSGHYCCPSCGLCWFSACGQHNSACLCVMRVCRACMVCLFHCVMPAGLKLQILLQLSKSWNHRAPAHQPSYFNENTTTSSPEAPLLLTQWWMNGTNLSFGGKQSCTPEYSVTSLGVLRGYILKHLCLSEGKQQSPLVTLQLLLAFELKQLSQSRYSVTAK